MKERREERKKEGAKKKIEGAPGAGTKSMITWFHNQPINSFNETLKESKLSSETTNKEAIKSGGELPSISLRLFGGRSMR